jgi:hypothetical protein
MKVNVVLKNNGRGAEKKTTKSTTTTQALILVFWSLTKTFKKEILCRNNIFWV